MGKGGISIPPYLVATMIAIVIVIGIAWLFLTETGKNMMEVFRVFITESIRNLICNVVPVVGQIFCS